MLDLIGQILSAISLSSASVGLISLGLSGILGTIFAVSSAVITTEWSTRTQLFDGSRLRLRQSVNELASQVEQIMGRRDEVPEYGGENRTNQRDKVREFLTESQARADNGERILQELGPFTGLLYDFVNAVQADINILDPQIAVVQQSLYRPGPVNEGTRGIQDVYSKLNYRISEYRAIIVDTQRVIRMLPLWKARIDQEYDAQEKLKTDIANLEIRRENASSLLQAIGVSLVVAVISQIESPLGSVIKLGIPNIVVVGALGGYSLNKIRGAVDWWRIGPSKTQPQSIPPPNSQKLLDSEKTKEIK